MFTMQEAHLYCQKCREYYNLCRNCRKLGCPKCGSRLLDMWEYEKEINGKFVIF
jgi:Zn finger protein HypA/HybF involved in hydrogenase expression